MGTVKIKMKDRYAFGWADPRAFFGNNTHEQDSFKVNKHGPTGLKDVPTEVLRNLFLVKFGGRVVSITDAHELRTDDIMNVVQELIDRNQIRHERHSRPDTMTEQAYFVLEREDGDH
jgi:hypothetical protein